MMWTVTVVLLILWAVGFFGFGTAVGYWIHILIVLAIISLIFNLMSGRLYKLPRFIHQCQRAQT